MIDEQKEREKFEKWWNGKGKKAILTFSSPTMLMLISWLECSKEKEEEVEKLKLGLQELRLNAESGCDNYWYDGIMRLLEETK